MWQDAVPSSLATPCLSQCLSSPAQRLVCYEQSYVRTMAARNEVNAEKEGRFYVVQRRLQQGVEE
jgi:hypothetical protein